MNQQFFTVKFQFPFLWKLFFAATISLTVAILTLPNFRKFIYKAVPIKLAAVHLNASKINDTGRSLVDLLQTEDAIYSVDKYKILKHSEKAFEKELAGEKLRSLGKGKYQALSCAANIENSLYAGDWYGGLYSKKTGQWKKVYQHKDKCRIVGIHLINNTYHLVSNKGIISLSKNFEFLTVDRQKDYFVKSIEIKDKIYVLSRSNVLTLKNQKWESVYKTDKSIRLSNLANRNGNLILLTNKGLMYLDNQALSSGGLSEFNIIGFASDGEFEVATDYNEGIFIRKVGEEWFQFPSPIFSKKRAKKIIINKGQAWLAYYAGGLYKIDIERLHELESE